MSDPTPPPHASETDTATTDVAAGETNAGNSRCAEKYTSRPQTATTHFGKPSTISLKNRQDTTQTMQQ